jgi:enediyne polyketide synthase
MNNRVAIVGMACRYADARTPIELWENALSGRRAFRRIPTERLRLEDYYSADPSALDSIYTTEACVIEGYEFDRVKYRIAGSTHRSADYAHWLALDVAADSLEDAGFRDGENLPRETTGVLVGNTLTGEFSRANSLRLRWPYVRRVLLSALIKKGWPAKTRAEFLRECEDRFKQPFPQMNEESLAGNLSNTIAGRICNYFDLKGSGYTVDAACASSLLAIANSCSALIAGDLDIALAGGVDLSIDPFELVGFARAGALARGAMRVYDQRSSGFLPGEGCGFVVMMRHQEALDQGRRIYAVISGWGVSSDGAGGITRPESDGQLLALRRAYKRAGFGIETVAYFEGHGTGTSVGDATELKTLSDARRSAKADYPAAIGSIKANIGHTKAAAGVAGMIKAVMAVHNQIIPPTTGCQIPRQELNGDSAALSVSRQAQLWPAGQAVRAGVSAMGFGGINTHIVIEGIGPRRHCPLTRRERTVSSSEQDAEVFIFASDSVEGLSELLALVLSFAARLSYAELGDLAAELGKRVAAGPKPVRAAIVASTPAELEDRIRILGSWLDRGLRREIWPSESVFVGEGSIARIGFLFPGQSSPVYVDGGALARRFPSVRDFYSFVDLPSNRDRSSTELAQPAIIISSIAALRLMEQIGIEADLAIGHSVGEVSALHWAGAMDQAAAIRIASVRGRVMAGVRGLDGKMISIKAPKDEVGQMLSGSSLVIACINSADQTVVSGPGSEVEELVGLARHKGLAPVILNVSHAFHSALVAPAISPFIAHLASESLGVLRRKVISTVTGAELAPTEDLPGLLGRQIVSPVLFAPALKQAAPAVDLFVEVGPGSVLSGIVRESVDTPVISLDSGGESLEGLLKVAAAAYVLGAPIDTAVLFGSRLNRPFNLDWSPRFFVNPCELAPVIDSRDSFNASGQFEQLDDVYADKYGIECDIECAISAGPADEPLTPSDTGDDILELVRGLVAERTDLPVRSIRESYRLLGDLHLNSITVSQIVAEAARRLTLAPPLGPTDYSTVSIADLAAALGDLRLSGRPGSAALRVAPGVDSWVRCFEVSWVTETLPGRKRRSSAVGNWELFAPPGCGLAEAMRHSLAQSGTVGVAVVLGPAKDESYLGLLLEGGRAALSNRRATHFLLVRHEPLAAAFVRTLHLEAPWINCCVAQVPRDNPQVVEWIRAEVESLSGFTEVEFDTAGVRRRPALRLLAPTGPACATMPGVIDVALVSGGGKGIAAECALALARQTGARLAIVGRSLPERDPELAANLQRLASYGIKFSYYTADVTDRDAVLEVGRRVQNELGSVTGIIHGAGVNRPKLIESLTKAECLETINPKVQGARNLLDSIDPRQLRLLVTFGSLIARTGMRGEGHYALANEMLRDLTDEWQASHPHCKAMCIEWSVWAGPGMGQRLGALDALLQEGISPISLDQGLSMFSQIVAGGSRASSLVVTGRFGEPPTVWIERPELPFLRFLEHTRTYYPAVELVADADLSALNDPYLDDHIFQGDALFPAVMGLEAMAQAAMALAQTDEPPIFEEVEFNRAIVVPRAGLTNITISALAREPGAIEVVIRSDVTDYQVNHFRGRCRFAGPPTSGPHDAMNSGCRLVPQDAGQLLDLDPGRDLYGTLLFHRGRFVRVRGYYKITATECIAEIGGSDCTWFGPYLPRGLVLGCPGRRDAVIHAVQVCVPDASLLPVGVGTLRIYRAGGPGSCRAIAKERDNDGDVFVYDVDVVGEDGTLLESWEGLKLRRMGASLFGTDWPLPLLAPYLERMACRVGGSPVSIILESGSNRKRTERSNSAILRAIGKHSVVVRRPDGRPEVIGGRFVSVSHCGDVTLVVTGSARLACDIESVASRAANVWNDLLAEEGFRLAQVVSRLLGDDIDVAATRVWTALECLKKFGAPADVRLALSAKGESCVVLSSGSLSVMTVSVTISGLDRVILAVLTGSGPTATIEEHSVLGTKRPELEMEARRP